MNTYAYVGCRTTKERGARGKGIKVYQILGDGTWKLEQLATDLVNPSFLCFDEKKEYLYTIHGDFKEISSFKIDDLNWQIEYLNTVSTKGENPVHLSIDATNQWVFVANLQTGTVAVIPRNTDGTLGKCKQLYHIPGLKEGTISHPHQVIQDYSRNYLLVSCQGRKQGFGQVVVFRINSESGTLEETCTVRSREIAEPRHMVFHPNSRFCYGVNEKDYSVTSYSFDDKNGVLVPQQILPTLPSTYTGDGWASGIVIDNTGSFIIVSNRKHDSITSFKIDQTTGHLSFADCVKVGGEQPRFITMSLAGNRVVAANELSDTIIEFNLDSVTGKITKSDYSLETASHVQVNFK